MAQQILSHYGCAAEIPEHLSASAIRRVAIVVGASSSQSQAISTLLEDLSTHFEVELVSSSSSLPQLDEVRAALPKLRAFKPQQVIAIGGGRILDLAKAMTGFAPLEDSQIEPCLRGEIQIDSVLCPVLAVPTTAGSGSESTHFAVVYQGSRKFSLASQILRPSMAFLDGRFIETCSLPQRASCAIDALAQAVESFWSNGATDESRGFARSAIEKLSFLLPQSIDTMLPQDLQSLLEAANLAGRAIDISKTTAAHAYSYYFTYFHDVSHGAAVGLTLPRIFDVHEQAPDEQITHPMGAERFRELMRELRELLGLGDAKASDWLADLISQLGTTQDLSGIDYDLDEVIASVNQQRLGNNPVRLTPADIDYVFSG